MHTWGPWLLIVGGPLMGALWLYLQPIDTGQGLMVAKLSELGWTVKASNDSLIFEVVERPVPPLKDSAQYFSKLSKPFSLHLQLVPDITDLHLLAGNANLTKIEINAGKFTSLEELRDFTQLTELAITQLPYEGIRGTVDCAPLAKLTKLQSLNLAMSKVQSVGFLKELPNLVSLNLGSTLIADISPLENLSKLQKLEIRETRVTDLRPLAHNQVLSELVISGEQVPDLGSLANGHLKVLTLIEQRLTDLTPLGSLSSVENVSIWGLPQFDFAQLSPLVNLRRLQLSSRGFGTIAPVLNAQSLVSLRRLQELILGSLQLNDLTFTKEFKNLTEIALAEMPITSLAFLRATKSIRKVSLTDIPVVDVSPLLDLPQLNEVWLLRIPARVDVLTALEQRGVDVRRH